MSEISSEEMRELTANASSKSAKIRILDRHGVAKAAIARFLGINYQFVYNVLASPAPKSEAARSAAESDQRSAGDGAFVQLEIDRDGRVALPAGFVEAAGVRTGDRLIGRLDGGQLTLMSQAAALSYLGDLAKRHMPDHVSLIDALLGKSRSDPTDLP
jgi:bifunctional DNA-binding transcriptional regulator/antitoxin component of YhaV-PrlF toxin-antitoxin module